MVSTTLTNVLELVVMPEGCFTGRTKGGSPRRLLPGSADHKRCQHSKMLSLSLNIYITNTIIILVWRQSLCQATVYALGIIIIV